LKTALPTGTKLPPHETTPTEFLDCALESGCGYADVARSVVAHAIRVARFVNLFIWQGMATKSQARPTCHCEERILRQSNPHRAGEIAAMNCIASLAMPMSFVTSVASLRVFVVADALRSKTFALNFTN